MSDHSHDTSDKVDDAREVFQVKYVPASELTLHPESLRMFGRPEDSTAFEEIRESIRQDGIQEPLIVLEGGPILSGNTRYQALVDLSGAKVRVPVRVHPGFGSLGEEVRYIIEANTKRRQLKPSQYAASYRRLIELPVQEGGEKRRAGRPKKSGDGERGGKRSAGGTLWTKAVMKSGEAAAKRLGIGKHVAAALDLVFHTPGVPQEVRDAVEAKTTKPTVAAKAIKAVVKAQGGSITDGSAVLTKLNSRSRARKANGGSPAVSTAHTWVRSLSDLIAAHPDVHRRTWGDLATTVNLSASPKKTADFIESMIDSGRAKKRLERVMAKAEAVGADTFRGEELLETYPVSAVEVEALTQDIEAAIAEIAKN